MQLVTIVGPVSKFDETAEQILKSGCFQPENIRNIVFGFKKLLPFKDESKYKNMLKRLNDFCSTADIQVKPSDEKLELDDVKKKLDDINASYSVVDEKSKTSEASKAENAQVLSQLLPLLKIDINLNDLYKFEFIEFRFGRMTKGSYEYMLKNISDDKLFVFIPASIEAEYVWGIYFAPKKYIDYADGVFVSLQFERIQISDNLEGTTNETNDRVSDESKYKNMLKRLTDFCATANIQMRFSDEKLDCQLEDVMKKLSDINASFSVIDENIKSTEALINEDEQVLTQLLPLLKIDMNLNDLYKFEFIEFRFGRMTKSSYEYMLKNISDDKLFIFIPASIEAEYVWGIYFAPKKYIEYADGVFVSLQFERIHISDNAVGTPKEAYDRISMDIKEKRKQLSALQVDRKNLTNEIGRYINPTYTQLNLLNDTEELKRMSSHSENNFYTTGWVALNDINDFKNAVCNIKDVTCTAEEPSFTKSRIPTKLKNFSIFRPFEEFVRMYGTPQYNEIDPTPLVAITFAVIFGIMFGDLGQGLLIMIFGIILATVKKMQFGKIILTCGFSSVIFGTIYDSIFGYEGLINRNIFGNEEIVVGFSPTANVNEILIMAVGLGVVLIAVAMVMNIINGIKQKDIEKIFFEHNGLAGFIFYGAAVYALVETMFLGKSNVLSTPYIICFFVIPLFMIFFRHMLTKLVTGKKDILPSNIGEFFLENIFEMLEVLLSLVTNTISFVRVGAFALNHVGMMLVVFILAKTTATAAFGSGNLIVVIIGNLVVIGLEGLIVGIQVLRLEFYEIFGRFFSGDGNEFKPINLKK